MTPGEYDLEPALPRTCKSPLMSTIVPNVTMNQAHVGFVIARTVPRRKMGAAILFTTMKRVSLTGAPKTRAVQLANPSPPHDSSQRCAR